jgi:hypothetical protein
MKGTLRSRTVVANRLSFRIYNKRSSKKVESIVSPSNKRRTIQIIFNLSEDLNRVPIIGDLDIGRCLKWNGGFSTMEPNTGAAVSNLKKAAQRLQLSGELDASNYTRMMKQLGEFSEGLASCERRGKIQNLKPVNLIELIRKVAAPALRATDQEGNELSTETSNDLVVEGPTVDLRDLFCCLIEFARSVGQEPVDLRMQITRDDDETRQKCLIELTVRASDVPDFLRRKLWDAARPRQGEVFVTTEPDQSRIGFVLPLERRLAA